VAIDLSRVLGELESLGRRVDSLPVLRWAVVTAVAPLQVQLDADPVPLLGTPATLVSGLVVGDRVQVSIQNRRVTVVGRGGGAPVVAKLPLPQTVSFNGSPGNTGSVGGSFENVPSIPVINFEAGQAIYVRVSYSAQVANSGTSYTMIGADTSGAFVSSVHHRLGLAPDATGVFGEHTPYSRGNTLEMNVHGGKTLLLPAGVTTIRLKRMRMVTGEISTTAYPTLSIVPIGWA